MALRKANRKAKKVAQAMAEKAEAENGLPLAPDLELVEIGLDKLYAACVQRGLGEDSPALASYRRAKFELTRGRIAKAIDRA